MGDEVRDEAKGALMLLLVALLVLFTAIGALGTRITRPVIEDSTWPESAEFSQIESGADRFSEHETNVDGITVVVDHETGVQYLADGHGMTALLDVDWTPLRVKEATDD